MSIALKTEESIFAAALGKGSPEERAAYLDNVCGADAALRARVENLLRSHEQAGSFLHKPPAATVDEPPGERPGTVIGPYKLLQQIGAGGMGVVYMAEQEQPVRRRVALKIIKPGMDSAQVIARFEAERQALAMMDHPNIARVLDAGTTDSGRPYFVMELVKGVPITKFCDENQLTLRERLELFVPVCQAVQHAHTKGVIHRDLKPSNVLVALYDDRPVPKVIDFGVAKATSQRLTERTLFTEFGSVIGTVEYMSPEQAKLNALDIDTRSDVYSLGVLLYELLTGGTPLERNRLKQAALDELLRMIREEEPPRPSTRLSGSGAALAALSACRRTEPLQLPRLVRGELDWIVMKALEKDRTRRYETANGLARDIQRHLADEPVEACPPSAGYRLRKFARKYRAPLRVAGAFLLLLVLGAVVSTWQAVRATLAECDVSDQRDRAVDAERKAVDAKEESDSLRDLAEKNADRARQGEAEVTKERDKLQRVLYASDMNLIPAAWQEDNLAQVGELLNRYRPEAGKADVRGFEWHYWNRLSRGGALGTVSLPGPVSGAVFSLDGTRLAVAGSARDGLRPGHYLKVLDTASRKELFTVPGIPSTITSHVLPFDFSSDGTRIAVLVSEQADKSDVILKFQVWDVASGKGLLPTPVELTMKDVKLGNFNSVSALALSPDRSRVAIASCGDKHNVYLYDAETGRETVHFTAELHVVSMAFSHDGKGLVASGLSGGSTSGQVWETATGKELFAPPKSVGSRVGQVVISPDGSRAAVVPPSMESGVEVRDVITNMGLFVVREDLATYPTLAFNAGGTRFALAVARPGKAVEVQMWDVAAKKRVITLPTQLRADQTLGNRLVFSPDGKRLAGFGYGPTILVWDVDAGQAPRLFKAHPSGIEDAAFSPDSGRLYSVGGEGAFKVWDLTSGVPASPTRDPTTKQWIAISGNGAWTALASTDQGSESTLQVRDAGGKELWTSPKLPGAITRPTFSPDGTRLLALTSATDGDQFTRTYTLRVWDTATGKELLSRPGIQATWRSNLAFHPDGTRIAAATLAAGEKPDSRESQIQVWEISTGKELYRTQVFTSFVMQLLFSPDGSRFAAASRLRDTIRTGQGVHVWDAATGKELFEMAATFPTLAFSPDGRRLAVTSGSFDPDGRPAELKVCDTTTGDTLWSEKGSFGSVAFSPDGSRLAAGGSTDPVSGLAEVRVWDAATGRKVFSKKGHTGSVTKVEFSPDGRRLASASPKGLAGGIELKLWESGTGHELLSLRREGFIGSLAFSPDGNRLWFTFGSTLGRPNVVEVLDATPLPEETSP